jgi:hypothetical protein
MPEHTKKRSGPVSLFPGKRRNPVSLTLTPAHHKLVEDAMRRLGVTRADLIGLLIQKHAATVTRPEGEVYERLSDAIAALGGRLEHHKFGGPHGETWLLELGDKRLSLRSQAGTFPLLDGCYRSKPSAAATSDPGIDAYGVAELFRELAKS